MCFHIWNAYSFTFSHFCVSLFWNSHQGQENRCRKACFLRRLFPFVSFLNQQLWFASSASLAPLFISLSHLILYFSLSLFPYTQSSTFVNLHHLEIQGAGNYTYSFRSLKNFEHICPTLIPNVFSYFISLRPLTAAHECLFLFHRVLSDIHNVISTTHVSFFLFHYLPKGKM